MYLKAFIQTLIISSAFFLFHLGISQALGNIGLQSLIIIHSVLFSLTYGGYCLLLAIKKFDENKLGFAFLAVSTIKLLIAASLILVLVKVLAKPTSVAIHFAGMYFFYVLYLAYQTFKLLNQKTEG